MPLCKRILTASAFYINIPNMNFLGKTLLLTILVTALCGCKSSSLGYFTDTAAGVEGSIPLVRNQIKIEPDDELLINVTSAMPEATAVYNLPFNASMNGADSPKANITTTEKITYLVGADGNILFPVLGKIHVAGMTTQQLADEITRRIASDVEAPYVKVELINFHVNIMGEVQSPGQYRFDNERVTIVDALSKAGDLTVYGRRDNVTVWREENGVMTYHKLNLKDSKIYSSPYFYLKQNDMVYVEPTEARAGQADYNQNNAYKVSLVSAIVSGVSVIASLVIALVVK